MERLTGKRENHFVEDVLHITINENPIESIQRFIPNPTLALVFQYGKPFYKSFNGMDFNPLPSVYFVFPYLSKQPVYFKVESGLKSVVFVLNPMILPALFGKSFKKSNEIFIPAHEVMKPNEFNELHTSFFSIKELDERIDKVDMFLSRYKSDQCFKCKTIEKALHYIRTQKGNTSLSELTAICNVSKRTIERYFLQVLNVKPLHFIKLVRFYELQKALKFKTIKYKTNVIHEFGLTDHSHLNKIFHSFTKESPSCFIKNINTYYSTDNQILET